MRISELLRLVWQNITQNKFKTVMTSIGIIVGAATIVMVIAIGKGGQMDVADQFKNLNAGAIDISCQVETQQGFGGFSGGRGGPDGGGGMPSGGSSGKSGSSSGSKGSSSSGSSKAVEISLVEAVCRQHRAVQVAMQMEAVPEVEIQVTEMQTEAVPEVEIQVTVM